MRNLALSDDILMKVEKPARYIGNEVNSVMKSKPDISVRFAMCFQMSMKLACHTWVFKFSMICLIALRILGVSAFILRGRI